MSRWSHALIPSIAILLAAWTRAGDDLQGLWEPLVTSRGGIGTMVEFTPNGLFIRSTGALVRGRYSADTAALTLVFDDEKEGVRTRFRVRGDTMIQYAPMGPDSMVMTRIRRGASGIQGDWTYEQRTGTSLMRFRADSSFRLWIRFRSDTVGYELRQDTIVTSGPQPMWILYKASAAELELRILDRPQTMRYVRDRE